MQKPKILQLCAVDSTVESLLKPLIVRSMEEGFEVHTVCTDNGRFDDFRSQGMEMIDVPIDRSIHPVKNAKSIFLLYKLMKQHQYDIVHVHTPVAALLGRIAAKAAGVGSVVYTAHGFYFHEGMEKRQYQFFFGLEKFAAKWWTDWLLLQSAEDYELSLKSRFKLADRTMHLSNGVDIWNKFNIEKIEAAEIDKAKQELDIKDGDFVFTFIGRMVREKGIFELVEAFKQAAEKNPHIKLLIIGGLMKSERDQGSYGHLMQQLEDQPRIKTLGFRSDIPLLMAVSDSFILPSHREGLPRSIIEAMAMGKPIIATNIRGCREQVFPGQNGILVEKENAQQLTEAMTVMAEEEELRKSFAIRSREVVEELFDEETVLTKQMDLFKALTAKKEAISQKEEKRSFTEGSKRMAEFFLAAFMLIILSPLFAVIALLVKLDSPGPVFFTQERGGIGGRHFLICKFRTMHHQHPKADLDIKVLATDERITKIGYFLRKTSMDELPQLLNILKGDMTFIGPRPALTSQTDSYDSHQKKRLSVKPGVTGLAQVSGRNSLSWEEKIELDIEYIHKKSVAFDLYILLQTIYVLFKPESVFEDTLK